jgi:hypothetical protein
MKKSNILCTWKEMSYICEQCQRGSWRFEGWDNSKRYRDLISGKIAKLCERCINARKLGEYRYPCKGCAVEVRGSFEEVRDLLGKTLCRRCMVAFFGRYDAHNPALIDVLAGKAAKKKRRTRYLDPEAQWRLLEEEMRYADTVRRLSRTNLRKHPEILNPHRHKLGRSGVAGAYQLDHIVPVSVCWEYRVLVENASSLRNLQVVPWFVNLSRGDGIAIEQLIGWPYPVKRKRTTVRY